MGLCAHQFMDFASDQMKTKHRVQAKAKHQRRNDPTWLNGMINRTQPVADTDAVDLSLMPRLAFESLRRGGASEQDYYTVVIALNAAAIATESMGDDDRAIVIAGQDSLMRVAMRHERTGVWGLAYDDLRDITPALQLWESIIRQQSRAKLLGHVAEAYRRNSEGLVLQVGATA